jgi:hypothetical protein
VEEAGAVARRNLTLQLDEEARRRALELLAESVARGGRTWRREDPHAAPPVGSSSGSSAA